MKIRKIFVLLFAFLVFGNSVFEIDFSKQVDARGGNIALIAGDIKDIGCAHNVFKMKMNGQAKHYKKS